MEGRLRLDRAGLWATLRPIIEASSATYAKEHGITPRDCAKGEAATQAPVIGQ